MIYFLILFLSTNTQVLTQFRVFRHGARLPGTNPPTKEYLERGYKEPKMLTNFGKQQNLLLGKSLSENDSEFLKNDTVYYASYSPRCIESGKAFIKGYLNKELGSMPHINVSFFHQAHGYEFKQINVEISDEDKQQVISLWNELSRLERQEIIKYKKDQNLGKKCLDVKKCLKAMKSLYTQFVCNYANNVTVEQFTGDIQRILRKGFLTFYYYFYGTRRKQMIASNSFIKLMGLQVRKFLKEYYPDILPKFYNNFKKYYPNVKIGKNMLMFGHDSNLLSLGYFFGGHDEMKDQDKDFYYFVDRLTFSLEVEDYELFYFKFRSQSPNPQFYPHTIKFVMRKNNTEIFPAMCGFKRCSLDQFHQVMGMFLKEQVAIELNQYQLIRKNLERCVNN